MTDQILYCAISNDPTFTIPAASSEDIAMSTISTFRSTIYSVAEKLMTKEIGESLAIKVLGTTAGEVPFTLMDIAMSWSTEGGLQATVTGVGGELAGVWVGVKIGAIAGGYIGTVPGAIVGSLIGGVTGFVAGKALDGVYDYGEQLIQNIAYNSANNSLTIGTSISNVDDIGTVIAPLKGYVEENVLKGGIELNVLQTNGSTIDYAVKTAEQMNNLADKYGMTTDQLSDISTNSWMSANTSSDGSFTLVGSGDKITIPQTAIKPVDYSPLIEQAQAQANGTATSVVDKLIPQGSSVPIPAAGGSVPSNLGGGSPSPTNIVYQYTAMPSGGGFWGGISGLLNSWLGNFISTIAGGVLGFLIGGPAGVKIGGDLGSTLYYTLGTNIQLVNPLSIDLDGDGIETTDINNSSVQFDMNNDGFKEKIGWIKGDDGMLAIDKNENGVIDNQSELFGTTSTKGFNDLKAYDSNNDGVINASDTQFSSLKVWQDANENGITDAGELKLAA